MPITDGEYRKLSKEEIQQRLENSLDDKLGANANAGDLVQKQLEAEAETLAQNQEEALQRVHQAAYLRDANGKELDKVVDIIGLTRNEASPATGVVRLSRETYPTSTYTIPSGSMVQTAGSNPIEFEVTQQNRLEYVDGFEDNNLDKWRGSTDSFSIIETTELKGDYALEVPATESVEVNSSREDYTVGTTFAAIINPQPDSNTAFRVGVQDESNYIECELDEGAQDISLRLIEDGTEVSLSNNNSATIPANQTSYLEIDWGLYEPTTATIYESKYREVELCTVELDVNKQWEEGPIAIASTGSEATCLVDDVTTRSVLVNVEAVKPGSIGNIGKNTITVIPNGITGIESVNNPIQTGNPTKKNTNFAAFAIGEQRETDEELRERAFNSTSIGGAATVNALSTEIKRIKGVQALTLNRNRDNVSDDGLPPHSFEAIVYGGSDKAVAEAIFGTASIDSHDVGGINGQEVNYNITSDVTSQEETISFSRPITLNLDITLDLIVGENYVGEAEIQSIIAQYVGGTDIDGSFVPGLDVDEDVYEAVLKREIVGPDTTGVWEVDSLTIDKNGDGTDDTTTAASGADVLAVNSNEVAITDARDGSITINSTQR